MTENEHITEAWLEDYAPQKHSRFWLGLHYYFDADTIKRICINYKLKATPDGRQVFPFYDQDFELRAALECRFDTFTLCPSQGQRGTMLPTNTTPPCLFGAHRLRVAAPDADVCVHPSPRDAVIGALADHECTHLATPDAAVPADDGILCRWFEPLRQHRLILYPPIPPSGKPNRTEWKNLEAWLRRHGYRVGVKDYSNIATYNADGLPCYQPDAGLADIVLQRRDTQTYEKIGERLAVVLKITEASIGEAWLPGKEVAL